MPIPKHLHHLYRGPDYRAFVEQLRLRAKDQCEECRKPNRAKVYTVTGMDCAGLRMAWARVGHQVWRDQDGKVIRRLTHVTALRKHKPRMIVVKLGPSHLEPYPPGDFEPAHSRFLCQWCHLDYDLQMHMKHAKETRLTRKDAARPLLQEGVCA